MTNKRYLHMFDITKCTNIASNAVITGEIACPTTSVSRTHLENRKKLEPTKKIIKNQKSNELFQEKSGTKMLLF